MSINILLIGCGPHAKRVYIPILKQFENRYDVKLKAVVEIEAKKEDTEAFVNKYFKDTKFIFTKPFASKYKSSLPFNLERQLNRVVIDENINGVIISTDPLNHIQYAIWAEKNKLNILMDKPISTCNNISNSVKQSRELINDYNLLKKNYNKDKVFIINAQRRFLPQFNIIQEKINEIAQKYGMPITSMQSTHCDGQWRLPNEILTMKYHPLLGWGKISHSGYHFIDMSSKIIKDSYKYAGKDFDKISAFSKFIRPSGLLMQQTQQDLEKIFGKEYIKLDSRSNEELLKLYKENNEAELDDTSIITFYKNDIPITNLTLNLIHNGFSRRSWMLPNYNDLYKGNGRLRHEYHNIQQGCLQNIQVHSYQSKDKQNEKNTDEDFKLGGNNHYDIYIFRNSGIIGGKTLEVITAEEIEKKEKIDKTKLLNEVARYKAVEQFLEFICKKRDIKNITSNITDHKLSVELMSLMYESGVTNKEIIKNMKESN